MIQHHQIITPTATKIHTPYDNSVLTMASSSLPEIVAMLPLLLLLLFMNAVNAFQVGPTRRRTTTTTTRIAVVEVDNSNMIQTSSTWVSTTATKRRTTSCLYSYSSDGYGSSLPELRRIPPEMEGVAIPFVDMVGNSFIECYADSVTQVDGVEFGVPCDYSVALCYFDNNQLVPVELDDTLMNDIFPIAESIVTEEYGEDMSLQRTPQTLTLVGELDDDEEEDEEEAEEEEEGSQQQGDDDEEEVEVLLSFEHRGKEFNLVRLLDPILLVGKVDPNTPDNRLLLSPTESERIMPLLEEAFVDYHDNDEDDEGYEVTEEDKNSVRP